MTLESLFQKIINTSYQVIRSFRFAINKEVKSVRDLFFKLLLETAISYFETSNFETEVYGENGR